MVSSEMERLYESIADVKDDASRWILYVQFIQKYFPKCYDALTSDLVDKKMLRHMKGEKK